MICDKKRKKIGATIEVFTEQNYHRVEKVVHLKTEPLQRCIFFKFSIPNFSFELFTTEKNIT